MVKDISIYAIYDRITDNYSMYFAAVNDDDARRNALMALRAHAYVEDFEIWHICDIDVEMRATEDRFYLVDRLSDCFAKQAIEFTEQANAEESK